MAASPEDKTTVKLPTGQVFELLDEVFDLSPEEREKVLAARDPAVAAEVRAMLEAETQGDFRALSDQTLAPVSVVDPATGQPREIGPYRLLEVLGEGGMGKVFLAEQSRPVKRRVAIKVLRFAIDSDQLRSRFKAERQALSRLDHPNIGKLLEAGTTDDGVPFFAMELIDGEPITRYCDRRRLSIEERLKVFIDVCRATAHAHSRLVLHRDLKPSNVMVSEVDGRPFPKIIDFGIAKGLGQSLGSGTVATMAGSILGTPAYMSPEALGVGGEIDTRSDVFSLGVLLYALLAGTLPWPTGNTSLFGAIKKRMEVEARRPSTLVTAADAAVRERAARRRGLEPAELPRRLRGDLDWIVMKAIAKDPDQRYASAAGLADELERYLRDEPVSARPPTAAYLARKLLRRHRAAFAGAAVALAAVVLGIVGTSIGLVRARQAEQRAEQRAADLEQVVAFQADRLTRVDYPSMGRFIRDGIGERLDAAAERRGADASELRRSYSEAVDGADFTGLALATLDAHVFEPALQLLATQFEDQPLVKVRLLHSLATTMRHAGLLERAEAPQAEALALSRQALGDEHPDTLAALHGLGTLLSHRHRHVEAETRFREVVEARRRVLGDDHPDTLTSISRLALVLHRQGRLEEAEARYREVLAAQRRVHGRDHPETVITMIHMGQTLGKLGRLDEALALAQEALMLSRRVFREGHPRALDALANVGALRLRRGELNAAEARLREALAGQRSAIGDDHPRTLTTLDQLATVLERQGRPEEAEAYRLEAAASRAASPAPGSGRAGVVDTGQARSPGSGPPGGGPPPEAIAACRDQADGAACQFTVPHGEVNGTCRRAGRQRACVPHGIRR